MASKTHAERRDVFQELTDSVVAALERGTPPWQRPWSESAAAMTGPVNPVTHKRYKGGNIATLGFNQKSWETGDPRFCSFRQALSRDWHVRKGARSCPVLFFRKASVEDKTGGVDELGQPRRLYVPVLRLGHVFHASDIEGIAPYVPPTLAECPWRTPEAIDVIIAGAAKGGLEVVHGGERACFSPSQNRVLMPRRDTFSTSEGYCAVLLHEFGHASGLPLNRDLSGRFASQKYAAEELVAQLASAYSCAEIGIPNDDANSISQHSAYVGSWISLLRSDKFAITKCAMLASQAAEWVLGHHPDFALRQDAEISAQEREDAKDAEEPTATASPSPASFPTSPHPDGTPPSFSIGPASDPADDIARIVRISSVIPAKPGRTQFDLFGGGPR